MHLVYKFMNKKLVSMLLNVLLAVFCLGVFVSCANSYIGKDGKNRFNDADFAAKDVVEKNGYTDHFLSLKERNAELCFEGSAKVHKRLGNGRVSIESRVGKLSWIKTYTKKGMFGTSEWTAHPITKTYFISNKVTLAGVAISTGKENFLEVNKKNAGISLSAGGASPQAMEDFHLQFRNDYSHKIGGLPAGEYFSDSTFFTECPSNAVFSKSSEHPVFTREYSIKPRDRDFTVNGRTYTASLFLIKSYVRGRLSGEESAWLCDEIPGRVLGCVAQNYSDDGTLLLGRTELTLKSFRTW